MLNWDNKLANKKQYVIHKGEHECKTNPNKDVVANLSKLLETFKLMQICACRTNLEANRNGNIYMEASNNCKLLAEIILRH